MLCSLMANDTQATLISSVTNLIVYSAYHKPGTHV